MELKKMSVLKDSVNSTKRSATEKAMAMRVISTNKLKKKGTVSTKK